MLLVIVIAAAALIALQMVLTHRVRLMEAKAGAALAQQATAPGWTQEELDAALETLADRVADPDLSPELRERILASVREDLASGVIRALPEPEDA